MFVAKDKDGNRLYADAEIRFKECYCPVCEELLIHKKGSVNIPHFAHKPNSDCFHRNDTDNKSAWHRRMQAIFPKESIEYLFKDEKTGEKHIADVYLEESGTIIDFQHSPISPEEFKRRTDFHLSEGRRVIWVFDEENEASGPIGRLKRNKCYIRVDGKYVFDYILPKSRRSVLLNGPEICIQHNNTNYSVFVYCGDGENTIHRIIDQKEGYKSVMFSAHSFELQEKMDVDKIFWPEEDWLFPGRHEERIMEIFLQSPLGKEYVKAMNEAKKPKKNMIVRRKPRL